MYIKSFLKKIENSSPFTFLCSDGLLSLVNKGNQNIYQKTKDHAMHGLFPFNEYKLVTTILIVQFIKNVNTFYKIKLIFHTLYCFLHVNNVH